MEEIVKMLGPWPILQFMFGVGVLAFGTFMIIKGQHKGGNLQLEEKRDEWAAYERLRNIEENSFKIVELLRKNNEDIQRLTSVIWNRREMGNGP